MNAIRGTFKNGEVVLDGPADWPEGCQLRIAPVPTEATDSDPPETPEQIEEWLRWYHALEPLEFTPEEEADLAGWRQRRSTRSPGRNSVLRAYSHEIGKVDIQIAAIALAMGNTTVVSADSDLTVIPGRTVENWASP